ncbi:MAG: WG repeat-containing protein [Bacteroidota bacterium]
MFLCITSCTFDEKPVDITDSTRCQLLKFNGKNYKYGFINQYGKVIIEPEFDTIYRPKKAQKYISVKKSGKWGVIDSIGQLVCPIEYDFVESILGGTYFSMRKGEKYGVIDSIGNTILPAEFDYRISMFSNNNFLVQKNKKYGLVSKNNDLLLPIEYDYINYQNNYNLAQIAKDQKKGVVNKSGDIIVPVKYTSIVFLIDHGLIICSDSINSTLKYGLMDTSGKVVLPIKYDHLNLCSNQPTFTASLNEKGGIINKKGEVILPMEYDLSGKVSLPFFQLKSTESYIIIKRDNKYGYVSRDGKQLIEPRFGKAEPFDQSDLAVVGKKSSKGWRYGFINRKGEVVGTMQYSDIPVGFKDQSLVPVKLRGKYGYLDKEGILRIRNHFAYAYPFRSTGYAKVQAIKAYAIIDQNGEYVVKPDYGDVKEFRNDKVTFYRKESRSSVKSWGVINNKGNMITPPIYSSLYYYNDANVIIYKNGGEGIMSIEGERITEPIYNNIEYFSEGDCFIVGKGGKYGLIDRKGKQIVPFKFYHIFEYQPSPNLLMAKFGQRIGYIDSQGNYLTFTNKELKAELSKNKR